MHAHATNESAGADDRPSVSPTILDPGDAELRSGLDDVCLIASRACGRGWAVVELEDGGRVWKGGSAGLRGGEESILDDLPEGAPTGRETVEHRGIWMVGMLSGSGTRLGRLVVGGTGPGSLTEDVRQVLEALGRGAEARTELSRRRLQIGELVHRHARVNATLRETEATFRGMFENTVVGIYQTTPDGRYLSANPMLARIYGYASPEELMRSVDDIAQELYVDEGVRERFVEAMGREDILSDFEARIRRKDGTIIWISETARVVRDAEGRVRYYEGTVQDVTARREAEERMRNSEVLYHSLVEELPQNVFRKDLQERFIFANTRFCQTVGKSWAELEGRTDFDLYPEELARKYQADDQRVIAEGKTVRVTEKNVTPDGETRWVEVIKTPLKDHREQIVGIQGIFWDVTATKRLQDALAYERDLLQALLDHIPDSIYFKDPQSRFVKVGRAMARRFEVADPEQLVGRTVFDLLDPALAAALHDEEQELLRTGAPIVNKVETIVDQKGGVSWASVTKVPIYDRAGQILGLVGVARDITQLMETEQALRVAEEKYRAIFENSVEGVFQTTLDGRFLQANPALARIYGSPSIEDLLAARTDVRTQVYVESGRRDEFVRQVLEKGSITGFESEIYRLDGSRTWVSESARVVRHTDGSPAYFEGTIEDITPRKQIEAEREKARQAALESARMKSEFVATVSHEIRTPLNAIVPSAEQLQKTRLDRQQRYLVDSIEYGAQMLLQIVSDILEVSRIEADAITLEDLPFDLHELVERTASFFASHAHAKHLELASNIRSGVPRRVCGDAARLGQVFNNLLGNAIKFTDRGEVVLEAEVREVDGDQARVAFKVRDTGIGIPPEARARVFTAFAQADGSMARRYGGTGLGLTISRRIVQLMGGDLDFESEVGRGTTFQFQVSLRLADAGAPEVEPVRLLVGHRVLVLDDCATHREVLSTALARLGAVSVATAPDMSAALEELRQASVARAPIDLVIFDAELPGNDLVQAARRLRAGAPPGCRLVALTAPGAVADDRGLEAAGLSGTLVKPVRQSRLAADLGAVFGGLPVPEAPSPAVPAVAVRDLPGAGLAILLVEDNLLNQRVAGNLLQRLGASVDAASSGPEALAALERRWYDLILMDCQMPDMDGYETTRRIREAEAREGHGRHVPIVALSANALAGDRDRGLEAGMDDYLTKPLRHPEMARILRAIAQRGAGLGPGPTPAPLSPVVPPASPAAAGGSREGAADDVPILDVEPLRALGPADDPSVAEFVDAFTSEAPTRVDRIAEAVSAGDAPKVALEVHSLKGNASYMGVRRVVRACADMEAAARAGDLSGADEALSRIRAELETARAALRAYLGRSEEGA